LDCCIYLATERKKKRRTGERDALDQLLKRFTILEAQVALRQIALNRARRHQGMSAGWKGKTRTARVGKPSPGRWSRSTDECGIGENGFRATTKIFNSRCGTYEFIWGTAYAQ
jgi:hypothetical protein